MNDRVMWFGRHEGWLRWLAHGVKDGDPGSIRKAAGLFDLMLPDECVVIPMPSHNGRATTMRSVMNVMAATGSMKRFRAFDDCLSCTVHLPCYDQKKMGLIPSPFKVWKRSKTVLPMNVPIFVIDNCIGSGMTAQCALAAFDLDMYDVRVCALTRGVGK